MKNIIENDKYKLEIFNDFEATNPREFETLGTMVCFHNRYRLGDQTELNSYDFSGWDDLERYLYKKENALIVIPIFLYDHSGLAINTTGFSSSWDSGQIGFIYVSKEKIRDEFRCKRISKKLKEQINQTLCSEVNIYNDYLSGNVYGFSVTDKSTREEISSCYDFYGTDYMGNGIFDYASEYFTELEFKEVLS